MLLLLAGLLLTLPLFSLGMSRLLAVEFGPLTKHAETSHATQKWNPTTIKAYMEAGNCEPTKYACHALMSEVYYCQINPDKAIGLVVAEMTQKVITGFMASLDYWRSRC